MKHVPLETELWQKSPRPTNDSPVELQYGEFKVMDRTCRFKVGTSEDELRSLHRALLSNLDAANEAKLRCSVERDSSLAEFARLFAQRLDDQVIAVVKDGLEALNILEKTGARLDDETKNRLMSHVQIALKFKGLEA